MVRAIGDQLHRRISDWLTFRRFVKLLFLAVILIATLFGAAKFAGCDATPLQSRVGHETEVVKKQAERERDYLKGLLPSSAAAGLGVFWGFWRRSRGLLATVPPEVADGPPPPLKGAG